MKNLIEALQIFAKYTDDESPTSCDHDILYVLVDPSDVSDEDTLRLRQLGFTPSDNDRNFYSFCYGSA